MSNSITVGQSHCLNEPLHCSHRFWECFFGSFDRTATKTNHFMIKTYVNFFSQTAQLNVEKVE